MNFKAILKAVIYFCLGLSFAVFAAKSKNNTDIKELSGISIIGNKEAPKSLYIVPWQNSEVGVATSLRSGLLEDNNRAIDKDVFLRQLNFYTLSHKNNQK